MSHNFFCCPKVTAATFFFQKNLTPWRASASIPPAVVNRHSMKKKTGTVRNNTINDSSDERDSNESKNQTESSGHENHSSDSDFSMSSEKTGETEVSNSNDDNNDVESNSDLIDNDNDEANVSTKSRSKNSTFGSSGGTPNVVSRIPKKNTSKTSKGRQLPTRANLSNNVSTGSSSNASTKGSGKNSNDKKPAQTRVIVIDSDNSEMDELKNKLIDNQNKNMNK